MGPEFHEVQMQYEEVARLLNIYITKRGLLENELDLVKRKIFLMFNEKDRLKLLMEEIQESDRRKAS